MIYRSLNVMTDNNDLPVLLEDLKSHLRITFDDDDNWLTMALRAATDYTETFTNNSFLSKTYELRLDAWPANKTFILPRVPLSSVTSIIYKDTDQSLQTLAVTEYTADTQSKPGRITEAYSKQWPALSTEPNSVRVTYVAGYGAAVEDVPMQLRHAIMLLVGHMYENRESSSTIAVHDLPMGYDALCQQYRYYVR